MRRIREHLDSHLSILALDDRISTAPAKVMDVVLRRKAVGAEALAVQREAVLGGRYPHLQGELDQLTALRLRLAERALAGPGSESPDTHRRQLETWFAEIDRLESDLARQIPELNLAALQEIDHGRVAAALPDDAVLVEFVRFNVIDFVAVPAHGGSRIGLARYLAFVLAGGPDGRVQSVDLGVASRIDALVAQFRAAVTGEAESGEARAAVEAAATLGDVTLRDDRSTLRSAIDVVTRHIGADAAPEREFASVQAGQFLRKALLDPLLPALKSRRRLYLAPDGNLARLPFEALPLDDDRYLIDAYEIVYLSAGRDLVRFAQVAPKQAADPIVVADPDFNLAGASLPGFVASRPFRPLSGTRQEGRRIADLLGVSPILGDQSLEEMLKGCHSPRILHVATHGFFLPDARQRSAGGDAQAGFGDPQATGLDRLALLESPLLRSGLALAGANTWLQEGDLPANAEDGIMTAVDVTAMDLLDTEMVVLSACETGLGQIQAGEGVLGLRRAFVLAGAKTLLMSLWKVPDQHTQELMVDFYQRALEGEPRAQALREAQLAIKKRYPDPFYWGAFICQGDPGPLRHLGSR
jgi:CHAT domain-containing protein